MNKIKKILQKILELHVDFVDRKMKKQRKTFDGDLNTYGKAKQNNIQYVFRELIYAVLQEHNNFNIPV